ncbi:c2H2-type domain-containing protein [Caerostris extrusa]|uniref:C2H2-type domain-containing protein n=1 Tax=Caerostris extrusa TaxID=172846 RepID=A0AAV4ND56_CAEEX|nr:c2H2-type domain-containing protein [Caerostris extrusa]
MHTVLPPSHMSYNSIFERHEAVSYTIIATDVEERLIFHEYYAGENVIQNFLNTLKFSRKNPKKMHSVMPMVENPNTVYDLNTCHICKKNSKWVIYGVRDHCHWGSGYINGLAHQSCNLNYRATYFVPVVIHNSRNYDTHLILKIYRQILPKL